MTKNNEHPDLLDAEDKNSPIREIVEYSPIEAGLAELTKLYGSRIFDVQTTAGDKEARDVRQKMVKLRTRSEAVEKELLGPAKGYVQLIKDTGSDLRLRIKDLEEPIDIQIKAEEKRKADLKAERDRKEKIRIDAIREKINQIRNLPVDSVNDSLEDLQATLEDLNSMEVTAEVFFEFMDEAASAVATATLQIAAMIDDRAMRAAAATALAKEQARLAEEQEKLNAERKQQEDDARELAELRAYRAQMEAASKAPAPVVEEKPLKEALHEKAEELRGKPGQKLPGGQHFSETTFKDNGEPIMLNADGTRSVFCDIADDMEDEPAPGRDDGGPLLPAEPAARGNGDSASFAPGNLTFDISYFTGLHMLQLSEKVKLCGFDNFADQLRMIGTQVMNGEFTEEIESADPLELYNCDIEMARISTEGAAAIIAHKQSATE